MRKINLLIITNLFPNPAEPNRGIFVAEMVKELKNRVELTVLSPMPWFPRWGALKRFKHWNKFSQIPENYEVNGQEVICPKYLAVPKLGFLHSFFLFISLYSKVKQLHKEKRFNLINVHWIFPDGVAGFWISRLLKIPIVLTAHGTDVNSYLNMALRKHQILAALKGADKIIVVSQSQRNKLIERRIEPIKIEVVQNGFNDIFTIYDKISCRKELNLAINCKTIAFIGRLVQVKGFDFLIKATQELGNILNEDYEIAVVGDGSLRKFYETQVKNAGLSKRIRFYGEKSHSELCKWFCASDIICMPSLSEGCPTVLIEALACGRPVVASRVGEIPNLIKEYNGILFEPRDVKQLTDSLYKALQKKWDADLIRKSVEHMTWRSCADKYLKVYEELVCA